MHFPVRVRANRQKAKASPPVFLRVFLRVCCRQKLWPRFRVSLPASNESMRNIPYRDARRVGLSWFQMWTSWQPSQSPRSHWYGPTDAPPSNDLTLITWTLSQQKTLIFGSAMHAPVWVQLFLKTSFLFITKDGCDRTKKMSSVCLGETVSLPGITYRITYKIKHIL